MCFCVSRVCGVLCRSRSLHCLSLSPLGVEQPGGVGEERSSQSVRGAGEWQRPVTEAAPFLEMALCSGRFTLSVMDRSRFSICHSATDVSAVQFWACLPHQFVQACCVHFLEAAEARQFTRKCTQRSSRQHAGSMMSRQGATVQNMNRKTCRWSKRQAYRQVRNRWGSITGRQAGRKTTLQSLA